MPFTTSLPRKSPMLLLAAITLGLSAAAFAGGKATLEITDQPDDTMSLTWQDADTLHMAFGEQPGYVILRDGKAYLVTDSGDTPQVIDMQGMMKMMQGMGDRAGQKLPAFDFHGIDSLEATGETEIVAGIEGRVYHMTWTDSDGNRETGETVLTDDPLVVEMTRAFFGFATAMFGSDKTRPFQHSLPDDNRGLLEADNGFRIESIERAEPPASTFELPAKPMSLKDMIGGMGGRK